MKNLDESNERVIHRLEAFSDIVIGFSLAQLGLNLAVPAHVRDIFTHPVPIIALVITFSIVCRLWWSHHKLFTHFFVPSRVAITLNFVTLGMLLFSVYTVQLFVHSFLGAADKDALLLYLASFGLMFLLLGAQYLYGWNIRRSVLPPEIAGHGLSNGVAQVVVGVTMLAGGALGATLGFQARYFAVLALAIAFLARFTREAVKRYASDERAPQVG